MLSVQEKSRLLGFLRDDAASGDITSAITPNFQAVAAVRCNESCTLSGMEEVTFLFRHLGLKAKVLGKNGTEIRKGRAVIKVTGGSRKILAVERVALNVLGKMSGVATICSKASGIAEGKSGKQNKIKIYLTRKTTPGFSIFEKKACIAGGVFPHRKNLSDGILLKENHLVFFSSIADAVKDAKKKYKNKKIEIEAENIKEAVEAAESGADIILLDNFIHGKAKAAIRKIKKINRRSIIEISGGVGLKNLKQYVNLGADRISMGQLTKEAKIVDFSLDIR